MIYDDYITFSEEEARSTQWTAPRDVLIEYLKAMAAAYNQTLIRVLHAETIEPAS